MVDPNPLAHLWYWIEIHVGAINESKSYYGFWSGFGSDIGEVAIIGGIWMGIRKINCHVKGCPRIGHYEVKGTPYKVCRKHHPGIEDNIKITAEHIKDAHEASKWSGTEHGTHG